VTCLFGGELCRSSPEACCWAPTEYGESRIAVRDPGQIPVLTDSIASARFWSTHVLTDEFWRFVDRMTPAEEEEMWWILGCRGWWD
jgi:hypothetical protein